MDWISLLVAIGASGIITTIVTAVLNKRITKAQAKNSEADYAAKVIAQCEERVKHALQDRDRALEERNEAREEAKGQRKAKQDWRDKYIESTEALHALKLQFKDEEKATAEANFHRCEVRGCKERKPPRKED